MNIPVTHSKLDTVLREIRALLAPYQADLEILPETSPESLALRWLGLDENEKLRDLAVLKLVKQAEDMIKNACPEYQQLWHYPQAVPTGEGTWYKVAPVVYIPYSGMHLFEITIGNTQYSLLFSRLGMKVTCFDNQCSHLNMPLDMGKVVRGTITCPFHGYQFCLETGRCFNAFGHLVPHAVRVGQQQVEVFL